MLLPCVFPVNQIRFIEEQVSRLISDPNSVSLLTSPREQRIQYPSAKFCHLYVQWIGAVSRQLYLDYLT